MAGTLTSSPPQRHEQENPTGPDAPRMTLRPCGVVALWAVLLGALVATNAAFGNDTLVLEVAGSSAGFVAALAGFVRLYRWLSPRRSYLRRPTRIGGVLLLAAAVLMAGLSLAFGTWLLMLAFVPFLAALGAEVHARRNGLYPANCAATAERTRNEAAPRDEEDDEPVLAAAGRR